MSETEEGEWRYVYRWRRPDEHRHLDEIFAWDGGRYVFEWYAVDWDAQEYLFNLLNTRKDVPERLSEKAGDLFEYQECIDVGFPAPISTFDDFKAWADNYVNERGY